MYNEEFANRILDEVRKLYPDMNIQLREVVKNNNIIQHGLIMASGKERDIAPTIYVDGLMQDEADAVYSQEYLENVVKEIQRQYEISKRDTAYMQAMIDSFLDFDKMKDKIYFNLVNYDKNEETLKEVPHRKFLDLAITYRILIKNSSRDGIVDAVISNQTLKSWGNITEDELYNLALVNTPKLIEFESQKLSDLLDGVMDDEEIKAIKQEFEMENLLIVVSNKSKHKGAYVMLYQDYIREIIKQHGCSRAYILPSSIHEIIVLPENPEEGSANAMELLNMVKIVNHNEVDEREILSDTVYEITLTDDISIAASTRPWKGGWDY